MVSSIIAILFDFISSTMSALGVAGIVVLMGIESMCIPLPSELIMPFAGYLVYKGEMGLLAVAFAGALGCVLGSIPAYYLGMYGGRPLIVKYGKYILMSHHDLDMADRWFQKHGEITVFVGRLLPVVRTFIAFPAGVAKMDMRKFIIYTFVGSFPWCLGLAWVGFKLGENWRTLGPWFHKFDVVIGAVLVAGVVWYVRRHIGHMKRA